MIEKYFKIIIFIIFIILLAISLYRVIAPYTYNKATSGKEVASPEILGKLSYIINKKYEIILYDDILKLKDLYSSNAYKYIKYSENTENILKLRENFNKIILNKLEKKLDSTYVVYYSEEFTSNEKIDRKIIIKYDIEKEKAVILYDSSFGGGV